MKNVTIQQKNKKVLYVNKDLHKVRKIENEINDLWTITKKTLKESIFGIIYKQEVKS